MSTQSLRPAVFDDPAARERIRTSLGESLLVEASAGTGKTSELVRRIVAVLESGVTTVDKIVAVTFTHKAAGELKLRLRQGLDRVRAASTDPERTAHLEDALARLEEASIGTIHSFCAQILRERPVEAVVDPAFEELSEQEATRLFERAFRGWMQKKLGEPAPGLRRALVRLAWRDNSDDRPPVEQLQYAGRGLVEWRDYPAPWSRLSYGRNGEVDRLVARILETSERVTGKFRPLHELATWIRRAEEVRPRDYDTLEALLIKLLRELRKIRGKGMEEMIDALDSFRFGADADLAAELRSEMRELVDRYDDLKRRSGKLDFLDLLIQARNLVRDNPQVRRYLQDRFTHIFVDEFQDTDPLQAELLLLLAAGDPAETDWLKAAPAPGKLFAVGDPKQSIYKFRRADVVLYEAIRQRLAERGVGLVYLTRSFRAVRGIQDCVNAAFEPEMTGDAAGGQAVYVPLEEHAPDPAGQPCVVVLPAPRPYGVRGVTKTAVNACLPGTIAGFIEWLLCESGWKVRNPENPAEWVPVSSRHVCVLFRRFVNWGVDLTRDYARDLEARGIPHLLVGSKSFHRREEVETIRAALAAVEWPDDELSVFAALKGSLFAVPDATLLRFRHEVGRLHPFARLPDHLPADFHPVREALDLLADLHRRRNRRPVAETVNLLLEATRAHAGFALRPAGHQILANVYRVCDLARSFETAGGISFRGFVDEMETQAAKAEAAEAPVLEEGSEGVRLMTVHSAKGLEFPVVILADMTANLAQQRPERHLDSEKRLCAMRLLGCAPVELVEREQEEHARELAEGVRVAYVAATRARDLLVVPAVGDQEMEGCWTSPLNKAIYPARDRYRHAGPAPGCPAFGDATVLERPTEYHREGEFSIKPGLHVTRTGAHTVAWWDPSRLKLRVDAGFGLSHTDILAGGQRSDEGRDRFHRWQDARRQALAQGGQPSLSVFSASEAAEAPPEPACEVTLVSVPRAPGRPSGARFGTLVHAALRDVPLDAGPGQVAPVVEVHARLLGATSEEAEAAREAVAAAVAHPLLERARAAARCHRELPVLLKLDGGRLLEGVIDLAFLEDGAWQIVDFKTDEDVTSRQPRYQAQVQWYGLALERLTGQPVRAWLLSL